MATVKLISRHYDADNAWRTIVLERDGKRLTIRTADDHALDFDDGCIDVDASWEKYMEFATTSMEQVLKEQAEDYETAFLETI